MAARRRHRADERTSRVWIHGDLHAMNFGTYMNAEGVLVFDVNDFDEAYLGHFAWDLRRFVASLALLGWQKALPEDDVRSLARDYLGAYVDQVRRYVEESQDGGFALRLDNTGPIHEALMAARMSTRDDLLTSMTEIVDRERRFIRGSGVRELGKTEREQVEAAFKRYLTIISFVVSELSPYEADISWDDLTEPNEISSVTLSLGRATAKIHCVSDEDSDENLVDFQTEDASAEAIGADSDAFIEELVEFAIDYAARMRTDHALFVDAFRDGRFDLVSAVS